MRENYSLLPYFFYSSSLKTIDGIGFTQREIDVIACVLNGRSTKKISTFLNTSPRTVESHVRNVMQKLECNSRESIIDFIEKSHSYDDLKNYYSNLLTYNNFERTLIELSKTNPTYDCLLVYWSDLEKEESYLVNQLNEHLKLGGIRTSCISKKNVESLSNLNQEISSYSERNILIILPQKICEKIYATDFQIDISHPPQTQDQGKKSIVYLLLGTVEKSELSKNSQQINFVHFDKHKSYYFSFFELLKTIFPSRNCDAFISEFELLGEKGNNSIKSADHTINSSSQPTVKKKFVPPLLQASSFKQRKRYFWTASFFVIFAITISFLIFGGKKNDEIYARSDLIIPANSSLLNRSKLINEIDQKLKSQSGIQTIAIIGPGGAGKTTLARQYTHLQKSSIIWEINAESHQTLSSSFENMAEAIAKTEEDKKTLKSYQSLKNSEKRERLIIQFVKEHLRKCSNWFLIFDNVEEFSEIQKHFPQDFATWGEGKIIITTRDSNIQNNSHIANVIQIGELNSEEKLNLFVKIMNQGNKHLFTPLHINETKLFLENIPPFPLDVSVAAFYIKTTNIPYETYVYNLTKHNKDFEDAQKNLLKEAGHYCKTRCGIITLSLQHIINTHKDFADLLLLISLLDSQHIPRELLDIFKDKSIIDSFIYCLKKYAILNEDTSSHLSSSFAIHRSTQDISLAFLKKELNLSENHLPIQSIVTVIKKYMTYLSESGNATKMSLFLKHCETLLSHKNILNAAICSSIGSELGYFYFYLADYAKAYATLQQYLGVLSQSHANNYFQVAELKSYQGIVCWEMGRYESGTKSLEESIGIYKKYFPHSHAELARALTYLGIIFIDLGKYKKAINFLEEGLLMYENLDTKNYFGLAFNLIQLGNAYKCIGQYKKAKDILERSLDLFKHHLSKNTLYFAWATAYLGEIYREQGFYSEAQKLFQETFSIYKKNLHKDSLDVAWAMAHLGSIHNDLREFEKARALLEQSFSIIMEHFPHNFVYCAWVSERLADVYKNLHLYEKAKKLLKQNYVIYKKNYGNNHIAMARVIMDFGSLYMLEGHIEKAENFILNALEILENNHHPGKYIALENLSQLSLIKAREELKNGDSEQSQKLKVQAIYYLKQAQDIVKNHFPYNCPHIARIEAKLHKMETEAGVNLF